MAPLRDKFKKQLTYAPSGDKTADVVKVRFKERGEIEGYVSDTYDIHERIQSYADGCDVHKIVARYNAVGDPRILDIDWSRFGGDAVGVPTNLKDTFDVINKARDTYSKAPPDVLKKFPSFESFVGNYLNYKVAEGLKAKQAAAVAKTESEVTVNA